MNYLRIWLAGARYSLVRTMMFRADFLIWSLVELFWMAVNLLLIAVIYAHTNSIAGWNAYQMTLLVGTAMLVQRLAMGFFWTNLYEMARNIRTGDFDFFLAQPGHPLFMASTRKLDPDGLINSVIALGVVAYAAHHLGLHPALLDLALYGFMLLVGLAIHYSFLVISMSATFWMVGAQGIEGAYFTLADFGRLPREAFRGVARIAFVWLIPVVVVTNGPARTLIHGFHLAWLLWLAAAALVWFALAVFVFNRGLRRYASASS
ncbi:MAG: ABC transporter permease [Opitutaceae bacterium]